MVGSLRWQRWCAPPLQVWPWPPRIELPLPHPGPVLKKRNDSRARERAPFVAEPPATRHVRELEPQLWRKEACVPIGLSRRELLGFSRGEPFPTFDIWRRGPLLGHRPRTAPSGCEEGQHDASNWLVPAILDAEPASTSPESHAVCDRHAPAGRAVRHRDPALALCRSNRPTVQHCPTEQSRHCLANTREVGRRPR